ncbi:MAG TPA: nucleoside hydrolase [Burkholderiales bacterium]|nr:nucleoside hydrolase [Burkholderiales bacterium]
MRKLGIAVALAVAALLATLAVPIQEWRTGDAGLIPLDYAPPPREARATGRLWIDTDAACGHGPRTDPDDCLAIAMLARQPSLRIAGISTVAGNAPREVVDRTVAELASRAGRSLPVFTDARGPLIAALEAGPLTVVALGPLTNVAAVLAERPDLRPRIARLVAVMGRRPGHIFHPGENARGGAFLGHGPVFRDFNFVMDEAAAARVLAMGLPITLVPYDAARGLELTAEHLDRLSASGGALAWAAARARGWLQYWRRDMGREGFLPFDVLAAAYVIAPDAFGCARVRASVSADTTLFIPSWRPIALLVDRGKRPLDDARVVGSALYCGRVLPGLGDRLLN